jgi:threonine dehydratase
VLSLRDIEAARRRIADAIHQTPLQHSAHYSAQTGAEVYLKLEIFQPIRVFKLRGVVNKLAQLGPAARRRGVVTASSGNHGTAVAYVGRRMKIPVTVVVPVDVVPAKAELIERYGGTTIRHGKFADERIQHAAELAQRTGATLVHSFDDPQIIAGHGTVGLEIAEALPDVDTVLVPVGGGGLIAGIALALKRRRQRMKVLGVQAAAVPSLAAALRTGRPVRVEEADTLADGLRVRQPGDLTFGLARRFVDGVLLVDEAALADAVVDLLRTEHLLAEPSGAAPLAALLTRYHVRKGERVVLVISGGNISLQLLRQLLVRPGPPRATRLARPS